MGLGDSGPVGNIAVNGLTEKVGVRNGQSALPVYAPGAVELLSGHGNDIYAGIVVPNGLPLKAPQRCRDHYGIHPICHCKGDGVRCHQSRVDRRLATGGIECQGAG